MQPASQQNKTSEPNATFPLSTHTHTRHADVTASAVITRDTVDAAAAAAGASSSSPKSKRQRSSQDIFNQTDDSSTLRNYQSQPMPQLASDLNAGDDDDDGLGAGRGRGAGGAEARLREARNGFCFSQPAMLDDLILCTQQNLTQSASQNVFQKLVRRMTRFFVSSTFEESIRRVQAAVDRLAYTCRVSDEGVVSFAI